MEKLLCEKEKNWERQKKKIIDKKNTVKKKKLFLTASHVLRILLATENYFWIQESFFVYIWMKAERNIAPHSSVRAADGRLFIRKEIIW